MKVEALITSVDDPQLGRCLEAVRTQIVPFSNIIHMNMVCPQCVAFNSGMSQTTEEWVMLIGGDMILYADAVERITKYIEKDIMDIITWLPNDKVSGYYFGLYDTFLDSKIGYLGVYRGSLYRKTPLEDNIITDWQAIKRLRKAGWIDKKLFYFQAGTHFDQPDKFQVFKRFYIHGIRFRDHRSLRGKLAELLEKTGNPLYRLGIQAIEYAWIKKSYPGSHNYDFDKKNFEEFRELNG